MNKKVLENKDVKVNKVNMYDTSESLSLMTKKIEQKSSVFNNLNELNIITIDKSGDYKIILNNDSSTNIKIIIKENINATITEINQSNTIFVSNIEIEVLENANFKYLVIDRLEEAYINRICQVSKQAHVDFHIVSLNKSYSENSCIINLEEEKASGNFKLISVANGDTHNIFDVQVNNNAIKTSGDIWQKAVVKNGGKNEFIATGYIKKGCDEASNYQESRVLLLDEASIGDASPLLLINHYNVVAGHAAGVSRVNEEELYYLQTRGINKQQAERLMTIAFIKPLLDEIKEVELKEEILNEIENTLLK